MVKTVSSPNFQNNTKKGKFYKVNSYPKILQNAIANTSWSHALLKLQAYNFIVDALHRIFQNTVGPLHLK